MCSFFLPPQFITENALREQIKLEARKCEHQRTIFQVFFLYISPSEGWILHFVSRREACGAKISKYVCFQNGCVWHK